MRIWTSRWVYGRQWYIWRAGYWRGAAKTAARKYGANSAKARRIAAIARKTARVNAQWKKVKKIRTRKFILDYTKKKGKYNISYITHIRHYLDSNLSERHSNFVNNKRNFTIAVTYLYHYGGESERECANNIVNTRAIIRFGPTDPPRGGGEPACGKTTYPWKLLEWPPGERPTITLSNYHYGSYNSPEDFVVALGHEGFHVSGRHRGCEYEAAMYEKEIAEAFNMKFYGMSEKKSEYDFDDPERLRKYDEGHGEYEKYYDELWGTGICYDANTRP